MRFPLEVVDACCKIRDKFKKPEFIIGYRLSPEEPFDDGITMTETLALVRALLKKPLQFIHVSQNTKQILPGSKKRRRCRNSKIETNS